MTMGTLWTSGINCQQYSPFRTLLERLEVMSFTDVAAGLAALPNGERFRRAWFISS